MAEKNEVEEKSLVPSDLGIHQMNEQVSAEDHVFDVFIQDIIYEFVNHLSENEISGKTRGRMCICVESIIRAHKRIVEDVKAGSQNVMKVLKATLEKTANERNQLRRDITNLNKQICEECKKKITTEDFSSLSVQDKSPTSSESKVDGRVEENEDLHEGDQTEEIVRVKCPVASCGLVALLCLFKRKKIEFCPTKFIQKYRTETRHKSLKCTAILQNLSDLHFLERVGDREQVNGGEHGKIFETAKNKLCVSQQEAGLFSYSTESYNHCVTVYITVQGEIKIHDADVGINYIKDLEKIRSYELIVLKCDDGVPKIKKKWEDDCDIRICKQEFKQLSGFVNHEDNPLSSHYSSTSAI